MAKLDLSPPGPEKKTRVQQTVAEICQGYNLGLELCSQCGKCSAACPISASMDIMPRQLIQYLRLGQAEIAINAASPWLCLGCHTCSSRCPQAIDLPGLMQALRRQAPASSCREARRVALFNRLFLLAIRLFGRSYELLTMGAYNIFSGRLWQDIAYVPQLLARGKLPLLPPKKPKPRKGGPL